MNFFELMYNGASIGIDCYIGVMGIHAFIELVTHGIKFIHKKRHKDHTNKDFKNYYK